MTMTLERSSSSSLTRASSNLELLSQTAAWKNAVENPARVSPAEHSPKTNPVLSPKSNGSCVIVDAGLRSPVYSSSTTTRSVPKVVASSPREWTEDWSMIQMPTSSENGEAPGGTAVSQTGTTLDHQHHPVLPSESSSSATTGSTSTVATSSTAGSASVQASSFLPPALVSSMGLALPTDFSSVHSLFRHNSSSSEDVPSAVAATAPTSNESRSSSPSESAASGLATRQAPRPSFTLNPRSRGAAFVETTTSTTTFTPPGILRTSSSVSWTGTAHGETSSSARTSSSTDLTVIDELARDNALLRHDVNQKNLQIQAMQERIGQLEARITEFKQMPVGKISQIPVSDMLELMQTYGSEVSEHTQLPSSLHPNGKRTVQKASIVRQFRRWNPNFTEYFEFRCGKWVPKLGVQAELQRRAQNRAERRAQKAASIHKKQPNNSKDSS